MARFSLRFACVLVALSCVACINVDDRGDAIGKKTVDSGGPGGGGTDPTLAAFQTQLWSKMRAEPMNSCAGCHGNGVGPQFLTTSVSASWVVAQSFINLSSPGMSRIVTYPASGHNPCPPDAAGCAAKIQAWIEDMKREIP
jgi:hypothetical protein